MKIYKTTEAKRVSRKRYYQKNREQILMLDKTPKVRNQKNIVRTAWRLRNPDKARRAILKCYLKSKYNLTLEQYENLFVQQNNLCAICGKPESKKDPRTGKVQKLAIDHNHTTGQVRGLLCINCNKGIGHFYENTKVLNNAIKYIEQWFPSDDNSN